MARVYAPRPPRKHTALWFSHLALTVRAGLPITTALSLAGAHTRSPTLQRASQEIHVAVVNGHSLASAMAVHPRIFEPLAIAVVSAGERSGTLDFTLGLIAEQSRNAHDLRVRMLRAAIYPALVIITLIAVTAFLLVWVIPSFEELFAESSIKLPALTQIVLNSARLATHYGAYCLILLLMLVFLLATVIERRASLRNRISRFLLAVPVLRELLRKRNTTECMTLLACLVRSGIPIVAAVDIVLEATHNYPVASDLKRIRTALCEGTTLAQSFAHSQVFSSITSHLIDIGESTGQLDDMLAKAGTLCREELDTALEAMKQLVEPVLVLTVGAIVTILVLAMYLPVFEIGAVAGGGL
jgi:type II secretory pathway component PulF